MATVSFQYKAHAGDAFSSTQTTTNTVGEMLQTLFDQATVIDYGSGDEEISFLTLLDGGFPSGAAGVTTNPLPYSLPVAVVKFIGVGFASADLTWTCSTKHLA